MFLQQLSEKERDLFLSLAIHVAKSNGAFEEEEKQMVRDYCREMDIDGFDADHLADYDSICAAFRDADAITKKIVLVEALGVVYADGNFDDTEKAFLNGFSEKIGMDARDAAAVEKALMQYVEAYRAIAETVLR